MCKNKNSLFQNIFDLEAMLVRQIYDNILIDDLENPNIDFQFDWKDYIIHWSFIDEKNKPMEPWLCGNEYEVSKSASFELLAEDDELILEIDEDNISVKSEQVSDGEELIKQYGKDI